ncbi:MAG: radical SAM protein [bacterium]|nr:radical SAM protein [bacterium]
MSEIQAKFKPKDGLRVMLIRPYFEMLKHELGFLPFEPLGLQYIQASLNNGGFITKLYDCLAEHAEKTFKVSGKNIFHCGSDERDIIKEVKKWRPDIVMISGMFFAQSDSFLKTASLVKRVSPKIIVIGGGNFASLYYKKILTESLDFDFIIIGDGEETANELLNNLNNFTKIPNVAYRDNQGKIAVIPPANLKINIDDSLLPYRDFSKMYNYAKHVGYNYDELFYFKKFFKRLAVYKGLSFPGLRKLFAAIFNYKHRHGLKALFIPHACISTSRGCPNRCTFCAIHKFHRGLYRMRSTQSVLAEIDLLVSRGARSIIIVDDNFTVSKKRTIEICQGIIKRGYKIRLATPSGLYIPSLDRETLECLFQAGLKDIPFAIENGDQEFLDKSIRKNLKLEQAKEIVKLAREIGFHTSGFFIFGYPGETKKTMLKTLRFAFESDFHHPRFFILQPFPGTEIFETAKRMGALKYFNYSRLKVITDEPQIETAEFSRQDVKKIFNLAYDILKKGNYNEVKNNLEKILGW